MRPIDPTPLPSPGRRRERGGIAIVVALILLVVMTLAAFSMGRDSLREVAMTGNVTQATKAAQAADAALDWFLVWTHPTVATSASAATSEAGLNAALQEILSTTSMVKTFTSTETDTGSDMVFDNSNANVQQSAASGNKTIQSFDLTMRYLGNPVQAGEMTSGSGDASGGTAQQTGATDQLWEVVGQGKASVDIGGGSYIRFRASRALLTQKTYSQ